MNEFERNLLFAVTFLAVAGTLTVFVWQWWRNRDRD